MNTPSYKFKKMICAHSRNDRQTILEPIKNWLMQQSRVDPMASACYSTIQEAYAVNSWADDKTFKEHGLWHMMSNYDSCVSFQEIVKAKGVPIKNIALEIKIVKANEVPIKNIAVAINNTNLEPRKAIPKKIRGEAWKIQFGDSIIGSCFCCKKELDVFDDWHAGHIISHSNNGTDTADNLRPVCGSCNLSMRTENMDVFKARCYPN